MAFWNKKRKKETEEKIDALTLPELTISGNMQELKANMMSPISDMALQCEANGVIIDADLDSSKGISNLGSSVEDVTEPDEYIWVEGYKGMDKNMVCIYSESWAYSMYGRISPTKKYIQQYSLNEETSLPENEKAILCQNGYHFSPELKDVFTYYNFDGNNRFFKVRAYVNKKDYEEWVAEKKNKMVASKIIPYEEVFLDYDNVMDYNKNLLIQTYGQYEYVFTEEDFQAIYIKKQDKQIYFKQKFNRCIMELGWSQNFAELIWQQFAGDQGNIDIFVKMFHIHNILKALTEEGLSRDTAIICVYSQF